MEQEEMMETFGGKEWVLACNDIYDRLGSMSLWQLGFLQDWIDNHMDHQLGMI